MVAPIMGHSMAGTNTNSSTSRRGGGELATNCPQVAYACPAHEQSTVVCSPSAPMTCQGRPLVLCTAPGQESAREKGKKRERKKRKGQREERARDEGKMRGRKGEKRERKRGKCQRKRGKREKEPPLHSVAKSPNAKRTHQRAAQPEYSTQHSTLSTHSAQPPIPPAAS